ncbi:AAA family ATPase [Lysinibacillus piscis]|uniref:Nuclease SbcCD subunit C n=1 Tax=Lysinibacillus piscis TaxID=2518931 RepID=A0ABQ5NQ18_9BACI|nr:SMC family ATPase [Lysinibacillus sp. KH24]GLC90335.1 nuclease SbcCD subunit C [Lysinibacillus sp. KH24]
MKPLKLTMTAFGPYKQTEVIDFQQLGDHRLFVISGKTGAGKTTIFDAICYALYGAGSGEDRQDTAMLRSGFAEDDVYTAVELVFEMYGKTYQILRQPGHIKAKNKSITGKKIELAEMVDGQLDYSIVEKQQTNEIDKKLQDIIGLTKDQFSQIVMLPQGEFRKLLTSDSTNKEVILRKIFKTNRFGEMVKKLDVRRKEAEQHVLRAQQSKEHLLGQIAGALPQRSSALFMYIENKQDNIHQLLQALQQEKAYYIETAEQEQQHYNEAYAHHQKEQEYYSIAKTLNEQFEEQAKRQQQLTTLQEQQNLYEEKQQTIVLAEQAERLILLEQHYEEARHEFVLKEAAHQQAVAEQQGAQEALQLAQQAYHEEEAKEAKRQQLLQQELQLQALLPTVEAYEKNKQQVQQVEQEIENAKRAVTDNLLIVEQEQSQLQQLVVSIEQYERQLVPYEHYLEQLPKLREQAQYVTQVAKHREMITEVEQELEIAEQHYQEQKEALHILEQQWLTNQASILAQQLADGEPCPVCGSTTHPLTHNAPTKTVDDVQMEALQAQVKASERRYLEQEALLTSKQRILQEGLEQLNIHGIQESEQAQIIAALQETEQQIQILKLVNAQLAEARKQQKTQQLRTEQFTVKQHELEQYVTQQTQRLLTQQAIVAEQQKAIPQTIHTLQDLQQTLAVIGKQRNVLQIAWQASQQQWQKAQEAVTKSELTIMMTQQAYEEWRLKMEEKKELFTVQMMDVGFASYEDFMSAKGYIPQKDTLRTWCHEYALQLHTLQVQVAEGAKYLKDKEQQDLASMEGIVTMLREAYEEAFKRLQQMTGYSEACTTFIEKVEALAQEMRQLEEEAGQVKELYSLLNGQNAKKLSFERYIQISYLDRITEAANSRLAHLSNGQFELRRSDRLEKHAKQSGLGLDVYDAYTDQLRDVKSLSGGEKFNASLSLALGMADVMQSFQGNVRIDTMFIDEGFGSLDEEALNKAIDALIDLQSTGRMIGVISHVQELKDAMPAVLYVEKTPQGYSQTHFEVK